MIALGRFATVGKPPILYYSHVAVRLRSRVMIDCRKTESQHRNKTASSIATGTVFVLITDGCRASSVSNNDTYSIAKSAME